jgi:hypothetical protein
VTFTPPAFDGGAQVTSYIVTSSPEGIAAQNATSPVVVTGLTNGVAYTFSVRAGNSAGFGASSPASNSVTPAGVPFVPAAPTAVGGNAQATVTFTPPGNNGDLITGYTVTATPGGLTGTGASSPIVVSGLTNGVAYTFKVKATNSVGTGPESAASNSVTPATVPGAPTIGVATAAIRQATVAFTPPGSDGGNAITGYTATSTPGNITGTGTTSPITVTGLANGTAYTFKVKATNGVGTGAESAASNSTSTLDVPGAPTAATATAGIASASVAFTAPASNGGSAITGYTVTSSPGGFTGTGSASPINVTGLANGTNYTFTVTATNAVGTGTASVASNQITTHNVPAAPTAVTATPGVRSCSVAFTPGANNGSAITGYTVTSSPGGFVGTGSASPITVSGLANNTSYTFTVTATNGVGTSAASAASAAVTTFNVPGAPQSVSATATGITTATVTFSAPASNGGSPITSYTATSSPGGIQASSAGSPIYMSGLSGGTTYNFTVTATNAVGTGAGAVSNNVTTTSPTPPSAPTSVSASASGGGQPGASGGIYVYFGAPADQGGGPVLDYTVYSSGGGSQVVSGSPAWFSAGQGIGYYFWVTARNAYGSSSASANSNTVRVINYPSPPASCSATAGNAQVSLSWPASGNDGGSPSGIVSYDVYMSVNGGAWNYNKTVSGLSTVVTGLTNGNNYNFIVAAYNGYYNSSGNSAYSSASGNVMPQAPAATVSISPTFLQGFAMYPTKPQASSTATVSGGVGPFTYSWAWLSGGSGIDILNGTTSAVTVRFTTAQNAVVTYTGTIRLTVTDTGNGNATCTADGSVELNQENGQ